MDLALTHASLHGQGIARNNERLEFLGDRVLGLAVAGLLYKSFPAEAEGDLAKRHTALVQQQTLVDIAQDVAISTDIKLSGGERNAGGAKKDAILADALEALIGAIYLDGGFRAAEACIATLWQPHLQSHRAPPEDPKTQLQEWAQSHNLPLPEYTVVAQDGPDHAPQFTVEVTVRGQAPVRADAPSKRAAEKSAAAILLQHIESKT